jgi:hypothetical protein
MAEAAKPNQISKETLEAFLDRYEGLETEAQDIMIEAMNTCRTGPRAQQKELRQEMKDAGIRMRTFNALWSARAAQIKLQKKIEDLSEDEDFADDFEQLKECASALGETPFGEYLNGLIAGE